MSVEASEDGVAEVVGVAVGDPVAVGVPQQTALGRDDDVVRVTERLPDETLADARTVGVGRVDDVYADVYRLFEHVSGALLVVRPADDLLATEAHRAVPEPVYRELVADLDGVAMVLDHTRRRGARRIDLGLPAVSRARGSPALRPASRPDDRASRRFRRSDGRAGRCSPRARSRGSKRCPPVRRARDRRVEFRAS